MKIDFRGKLARVLLIGGFLTSISVCANSEIAIIANPGVSISEINESDATKLWMGKVKKISGSGKLSVVDATAGSKSYLAFYSKIANKKPRQLKIYWGKMMFSGKVFPPRKLYSDEDIVKWVSKTPGALGYVNSQALNDSVKILLRK